MKNLKTILVIATLFSSFITSGQNFEINGGSSLSVTNDYETRKLKIFINNPSKNPNGEHKYEVEIIGSFNSKVDPIRKTFFLNDLEKKDNLFFVSYSNIFKELFLSSTIQDFWIKEINIKENGDIKLSVSNIDKRLIYCAEIVKDCSPLVSTVLAHFNRDTLSHYLLEQYDNDTLDFVKKYYKILSKQNKKEINNELGLVNEEDIDSKMTVDSVSVDSISIVPFGEFISENNDEIIESVDGIIQESSCVIMKHIEEQVDENRIIDMITKNIPFLNIKSNIGLSIDLNLFDPIDPAASHSCLGPIIRFNSQKKKDWGMNYDFNFGLLGLRGGKYQSEIGISFQSDKNSKMFYIGGVEFKGAYKASFSDNFNKRFSYGGIGLFLDFYNEDAIVRNWGLNTTFGINGTMFELKTLNGSDTIIRFGYVTPGIKLEILATKYLILLLNADFFFTDPSRFVSNKLTGSGMFLGSAISISCYIDINSLHFSDSN